MKKVVIVDDNKSYYSSISKELENLGITCFPDNTDNYWKIIQAIRTYFDSNILESDRLIAKEIISGIINDLTCTGEDDIIYVIDYQLDDKKSEINGVSFAENFLSSVSNKVVFISGTRNIKEVSMMERYCILNKKCTFISKRQNNFLELLIKEIV